VGAPENLNGGVERGLLREDGLPACTWTGADGRLGRPYRIFIGEL
jgi:hypothetical protein